MFEDAELLSIAVACLWATAVAWLILRAAWQYAAYRTLEPEPPPAPAPPVGVVIPARNEAAGIAACLAGLAAQDYPAEALNVVIVDDGSTDATRGLALRAAASDRRFSVIEAGPLPAGWTGKAHACWQGAAQVRGAWLCFIDADTVPQPALLGAAMAAVLRDGIDLLSLEPRQELVTPWERLIIPAGLCALGCAGDLRRDEDPQRLAAAANGQFLLVRRDVYERVGGHRAVRDTVAEDSALAVRVKAHGGRFALRGAASLIGVRMYRSLPQLWEGLSKNVTETFGGTRITVMVALLGFLAAWTSIALPAALAVALPWPAPILGIAALAIATLASLALAGMHVAAARYLAIPAWYGLLFPIGYTLAAFLATEGIIAKYRGRVAWKGRVYPAAHR